MSEAAFQHGLDIGQHAASAALAPILRALADSEAERDRHAARLARITAAHAPWCTLNCTADGHDECGALCSCDEGRLP
jgi:hypothetical protein